jgi:hypothetical protein
LKFLFLFSGVKYEKRDRGGASIPTTAHAVIHREKLEAKLQSGERNTAA